MASAVRSLHSGRGTMTQRPRSQVWPLISTTTELVRTQIYLSINIGLCFIHVINIYTGSVFPCVHKPYHHDLNFYTECPACHARGVRYELGRGGCMYLQCTMCPNEFCRGCGESIKKGKVGTYVQVSGIIFIDGSNSSTVGRVIIASIY